MGEIVDLILVGALCEWCGVAFMEDYGYPVVCLDCWENVEEADRSGHQLAFRD